MARIDYIDEGACHITLAPADMIALQVGREILVPRATHEAYTRSGNPVDRYVPGTRALVVVLEGAE